MFLKNRNIIFKIKISKVTDYAALKKMIKKRLIDQYKQTWYKSVSELSKCLNFESFKHNHGFEKYLTLLPTDLRISFSKFRCTNHKLPIEKGRYLGIASDDRIRNLCNSEKLGK